MLFQLISYLTGGARRQKAKAYAAGEDPDGDAATLDVLAALEKFPGITFEVLTFLGDEAAARFRVEERDVYAGIDETELDRVVLDLPEPWRVVKHAEAALRPGGILVAYLPTVGQVAQLRDALDDSRFGMAETMEVLQRTWHVEGQSVRPDHRMVGHTGFLTHARLLGA